MNTTALTGLPHSVGAQFQAKFDGNCKGCDLAIYEGDLMGYVDDVAVCDGCYNEADQANHAATVEQIKAQREADRAADPEKFDRLEAAARKFTDGVKARSKARQAAEEAPAAIEPGIQALMAAGLLQGQEPGGSGVCNATITDGSGKVTEVAIPVPAAQPAVPSTSTVGDPGVAVLTATMRDAMATELEHQVTATAARLNQLATNATDWDPAAIAADVKAKQLQAGLQSAVDAGAMTREQAAALGWVDPFPALPEGFDRAKLTAGPWASPSPSAGLVLGALSAAQSVAEEDAILTALDTLPAYVGGFDHDAAKKEILGILQEAINYHPRSLQKKIGPSEIGTECDHCLAAKLAGWEQVDRDAWLPTVGTAVHSWIESAFGRIQDGPGGTRRFLTERKVSVGEIDGVEITGSTDLVDVVLGCTWDWKIVGPTTLKSAKTGPSRRYVIQQMLYGRGWNRLGVKVTRVGIAYLPRNAMSLSAGVWWSAEYDEEIAVTALERASGFARNIKALEGLGKDAVDAYVSGLPRWREWTPEGISTKFQGNAQEGKIVCLDCPRYGDYPADPVAAAAKQLDGLI